VGGLFCVFLDLIFLLNALTGYFIYLRLVLVISK